MILKHEDNECRVVNVEAQLQQHSSDDMLPVEIQFDRRKLDSSLEAPLAKKEPQQSKDGQQQEGESLCLITRPSSSSNGSSDAAQTANSTEQQSPSVFSLTDMLSGTTATAANTTGQPASFFPNYIVPATDETSVMSTAYYDLSDFDPSNWANTLITEKDVMVGLAVVYLTISLTHPLLFLAGTLTAFGTATAVSAGYDYIMEGPLGKCLCSNAQSTTVEDATTSEDGKTTTVRIQDEQTRSAINEGEEDEKEDEATEQMNESDVSTSNTTVPTTVARMSASNRLNSMSTLVDGLMPENWVASHYPKLDHVIVQKHEFFGLNVKELVQVFIADNCPYCYKEFQDKRGDKNIEYGNWQETANSASPLSMYPTAETPFPKELDYDSFMTRTISFLAKTNNSFLGPPYAATTKEQRLLIVNKRLGVLEMKTTFADIPFCDRFYVMERWVLGADKDDSGNYKCSISTSLQVFFVKSCPFESQIRTKTKSSVQDVTKAWLHMATQALLLAEQHKQERIRQEQLDDDDSLGDYGEVGLALEDEEAKDEGKAKEQPIVRSKTEDDTPDDMSVEVSKTDFKATCDNEKPQLPKRRSFLRQRSSASAASDSAAPPKRNLSLQRLANLVSSSTRRRKNTAEN